MKNQTQKVLGTTLSAILLLLVLSSCETWRSECEGEIVIENTIPDTTLYVGGEPFERDLFEPPVVLKHTDNQLISIIVTTDDGTIVSAGRKLNPETQRASIVKVIPLKEGETEVSIISDTDCEYFEMKFTVTVIDTTTN